MVAVSPELNERLNQLCKDYGMSKSSLCAYYIGKQANLESKVNSVMDMENLNNIMALMTKDLNKF